VDRSCFGAGDDVRNEMSLAVASVAEAREELAAEGVSEPEFESLSECMSESSSVWLS